MNCLFVAQFWHQIWSPKREPKTTNFLPRNPDTFQPNFEQNLTKKSKKLERRKRYCKYPKKKTRPRAPNWQHKLATISPPARHTYSQEAQHTPPSTARNHHGEACFGACLGACFRHLSWFNQVAAKRFSCVPLASKCHKSQATRPCSKTRRAELPLEGCGLRNLLGNLICCATH